MEHKYLVLLWRGKKIEEGFVITYKLDNYIQLVHRKKKKVCHIERRLLEFLLVCPFKYSSIVLFSVFCK